MTTTAARRRARTIAWAVPATVLTTVAGALSAAPAIAAVAPLRAVPSLAPTGPAPAWLAAVEPTTPAGRGSSATGDYTVVEGDTLYDIALRTGTTVAGLIAANGLAPGAIIYPGDALRLAAGAPSPAPAAEPASAPAEAEDYVVATGDTLWQIAADHGISRDLLYTLNGLHGDSIIYPGQTLHLSAPAPAVPAPALASVADPYIAPPTVLDEEQSDNAALIVRIGRELGVGDRGIAIALATAMVESSLRNVHGGDRDSLGLFQQRPSTGWGSPEQIMDREHSTRSFFLGAFDPDGNRLAAGLLTIPDWADLRFTDAAQSVQISAYPERYGAWEAQAEQWLAGLG